MTSHPPLFVYGSLRQGGSSHRLLRNARFLGEAATPREYTLLDFDGVPGLQAGGTTRVLGELYSVDGRTLAELDEYEEHPHFYRRTPIRLEDGTSAETYIFVAPETGVPVPSGNWNER